VSKVVLDASQDEQVVVFVIDNGKELEIVVSLGRIFS
jgi:hypothetical protein